MCSRLNSWLAVRLLFCLHQQKLMILHLLTRKASLNTHINTYICGNILFIIFKKGFLYVDSLLRIYPEEIKHLVFKWDYFFLNLSNHSYSYHNPGCNGHGGTLLLHYLISVSTYISRYYSGVYTFQIHETEAVHNIVYYV